jgi:hypothetical protein
MYVKKEINLPDVKSMSAQSEAVHPDVKSMNQLSIPRQNNIYKTVVMNSLELGKLTALYRRHEVCIALGNCQRVTGGGKT